MGGMGTIPENDIIDMPKVNKIHVDHNNAFKLLKATDIHRVYKGNRQRIIQGWYRQAVQAGIATKGNSRKQSQINIEGSLKLLEQFKLNVDGAFFDKFAT